MFSCPSFHERMCRTWGSNLGPLACQANSLPIELPRPLFSIWPGRKSGTKNCLSLKRGSFGAAQIEKVVFRGWGAGARPKHGGAFARHIPVLSLYGSTPRAIQYRYREATVREKSLENEKKIQVRESQGISEFSIVYRLLKSIISINCKRFMVRNITFIIVMV